MSAPESATRQRILQSILRHPGTYRSRLCKDLGLSWGTVSYHVLILRAQGLVEERPETGRHILRPMGVSHQQARVNLALDRKEARRILHGIPKEGVGIQELSRRLDLSRKVVRRILDDLVRTGLLCREPGLRGKFLRAPGIDPRIALRAFEPDGPRLERAAAVEPLAVDPGIGARAE